MELAALDHINIHTRELDKTARFYERILGLKQGFRPEFPFPGAWLYLGHKAVVHLIGLTTDDPVVPLGSGSINHVAFAGSGLGELLDRAAKAGIKSEVREVPGTVLRQVFLRDPNDILIEINFAEG